MGPTLPCENRSTYATGFLRFLFHTMLVAIGGPSILEVECSHICTSGTLMSPHSV
jgi:hypothetical protein